MKILIFSIDSDLHGYNTFADSLIKSIKNPNIQIHKFSLIKSSRQNQTDFDGSKVKKKTWSFRVLLLYITLTSLVTEITKHQYNAILLLGLNNKLAAVLLKLLFLNRIKIIVSVQNPIRTIDGYYQRKLGRRLIINAKNIIFFTIIDKIITSSYGLAEELKRYYYVSPKKCVCIYNGVNIKEILAKSHEKPNDTIINRATRNSLASQTIKLFSIGRLQEQKDYTTLLKAFRVISSKIPKTTLFIMGVGPDYKKLIALAKKLNINNELIFLNVTSNPFFYLKYADIYMQTSLYEGFGYALVEAMALGKPVISTNCPYGPKDILENGKYGFLTKIGDHVEIADTTIKLISDKNLYTTYSKQSLKRAKYFDIEKTAKSYEKLLLSLI